MKHPFIGAVGLIVVLLFVGCKNSTDNTSLEKFSNNQLSTWNRKLTDIIITDVFSPPVCSRIYAYCNIAAYEALVLSNPACTSFAERLDGLRSIPRPSKKIGSSYFSISSIITFTTVAQKLPALQSWVYQQIH